MWPWPQQAWLSEHTPFVEFETSLLHSLWCVPLVLFNFHAKQHPLRAWLCPPALSSRCSLPCRDIFWVMFITNSRWLKGSTSQKRAVKVVGRRLSSCNSACQEPEAVSSDVKTVMSTLSEPLQSQREDVTLLYCSCWLLKVLCSSCNRGLHVCHHKCETVYFSPPFSATLGEKLQRGTWERHMILLVPSGSPLG